MTHVISLLVENHQGVLSRISGLFSGRGYNLESFTSGPTPDPTLTRITLVCRGEDAVIDQIKKQLNKLVDIIKVVDLTHIPTVDRELALIKVSAKPQNRNDLFQIAEVFNAKIMDMGFDTIILEIIGSPEKIQDMIELLSEYQILETARSGLVSIERGKKTKKADRS